MCVLYSVPDEFDGAYDDEEPIRGISLQSECYEADHDHKKVNTRERERVMNSSRPAAANGPGTADNSHTPEVPEVFEGTDTNNPQYDLHTVDYGREHVCALNTVQLGPAILTPRPSRFWALTVSNQTLKVGIVWEYSSPPSFLPHL